MTDSEKVYYCGRALNLTINSYKEMKKDTERLLNISPHDYVLKVRIRHYKDIIKILTVILENMENMEDN